MSELLLEKLNIASGFLPVDMSGGANSADYVSIKGYNRIGVLPCKNAGTAGDDPTLTIQQAQDVSGTGAKALNFTTIFTKQDTVLTGVNSWTKNTQSAGNTYTDATSAEDAALWYVEFRADELDVDNGFDCITASVADVGTNAQLGALMFLLGEPRYGETPADAVDPIVD